MCVFARARVFWGKQPYVYCSCRTHDAVGDKRGILTAPPSSGYSNFPSAKKGQDVLLPINTGEKEVTAGEVSISIV